MITLAVLFLGTQLADAGARPPVDGLDQTINLLESEHYTRALRGSWQFLESTDPEDPRYVHGQRLLAQSLEALELHWAASVVYRQIAQERRSMSELPEAMRGLHRIIEGGAHDEEALITSFIAGEEFGSLPADVQQMVEFYKGLDLTRRGLDDWAEVHFERLEPDSPYAARADYVRAVRLIADGDYAGAVAGLRVLLMQPTLPTDLVSEVRRTLARIAFEEERFSDALAHLTLLRDETAEDAGLLLELAWTHYFLGEPRETLGLLVAFDAPVHHEVLAPERYVLEALALRQLCQYQAARAAAVRLEQRHGDVLMDLSSGALPEEIPALREAARYRPRSAHTGAQLARMTWERDRLGMLPVTGELRGWLLQLYAQGEVGLELASEGALRTDLEQLTEELLVAEESVRMIVYELGVAMLRGRRRPDSTTEVAPYTAPTAGQQAAFAFEGEYWTDEMGDLIVLAEDRCLD